MKLHYSQTLSVIIFLILCFTTLWNYTILKHFNLQTIIKLSFTTLWNYTILKRWCYYCCYNSSFTILWNCTILKHCLRRNKLVSVLLHYEITLFSNILAGGCGVTLVLLPYEITLFSNIKKIAFWWLDVLLPYEITLFSNNNCNINHKTASFTTLWNYTILKHYH